MQEPINLCSNKCCPTIRRDGEHWVIADDYGGSVKLTDEELNNLIKTKAELSNA